MAGSGQTNHISVFNPSIINYRQDGTGRDTYVILNDQRLMAMAENPFNCNYKMSSPNFYGDMPPV
jgi:hypothetical protein